MSYGLHWEWRGFGQLNPSQRERIEQLPEWSGLSNVVDCYVWWPGVDVNLKLRQWRDGESLKLKRLRRRDELLGVELWEERPEDEYLLPFSSDTLSAVFVELGWGRPNVDAPVDRFALVDLLRHSMPGVQLIDVAKQRQAFVTSVGNVPVRVELADITEPEHLVSVGIEDQAGLDEESSEEDLDRSLDAVRVVREKLRLRMHSLSYLDALAFWARGKEFGKNG